MGKTINYRITSESYSSVRLLPQSLHLLRSQTFHECSELLQTINRSYLRACPLSTVLLFILLASFPSDSWNAHLPSNLEQVRNEFRRNIHHLETSSGSQWSSSEESIIYLCSKTFTCFLSHCDQLLCVHLARKTWKSRQKLLYFHIFMLIMNTW